MNNITVLCKQLIRKGLLNLLLETKTSEKTLLISSTSLASAIYFFVQDKNHYVLPMGLDNPYTFFKDNEEPLSKFINYIVKENNTFLNPFDSPLEFISYTMKFVILNLLNNVKELTVKNPESREFTMDDFISIMNELDWYEFKLPD